MKIIDKEHWNRREIFETFSNLDWPFYSVTLPIDITKVKKTAEKQHISFYFLLIWLCTKALNSVEAFRMRIRGNDVFLLESADPSFTVMEKGDEVFRIITEPWQEDRLLFSASAAQAAQTQQTFIRAGSESDSLIYFSCTPWFDFTAMTNERNFEKADTIPRLSWGRYYRRRGRLFVHLSLDVNHRTVDGYHIGLFKAALEKFIAEL